MKTDKLTRRLKRLNRQKDELEAEHKGNEQKYTYHGGFYLGYLRGKINEIEVFIDDINEANDVDVSHRQCTLCDVSQRSELFVCETCGKLTATIEGEECYSCANPIDPTE